MDFEPCKNPALRTGTPLPPKEALARSPALPLLPWFHAPANSWRFLKGLPRLLMQPGCLLLLQTFPAIVTTSLKSPRPLICTTCHLQAPLFSIDHPGRDHLTGSRCEPSTTCSSSIASISQISFSNCTSIIMEKSRWRGGQEQAAWGPLPGQVQVLRKGRSIYWVIQRGVKDLPCLVERRQWVSNPTRTADTWSAGGGMVQHGGKMFKKPLDLP